MGVRTVTVAIIAVLTCTFAACSTDPSSASTAGVQASAPTCVSRVTPDCSGYTYENPRSGTVVVSAPESSGGNNREFFWSPSSLSGSDLTVCAQFANGEGSDQQGIVLRLNTLGNGRVSAISVTRNVWMGAFDVFNFHVWNTLTDPESPFTQFGSTVIWPLPLRRAVYPLNMCARTVTASNSVEFVVWTAREPKPRWGSPTQGGRATIPENAPSAGRGGWFAGHLHPGSSMTYDNLTVDGAVPGDLP